MKQMLLTISAVIITTTGLAYAQVDQPVIDQRQANQEKRIDHGIASGQLNEHESNRLNGQQEHINKMEDKAKSDGVVTKKERAKIDHTQDRASRNIAREKHDRQGTRRQ